MIFHTIGTVHKGKNSLPLGAKFLPLREVPISKRDATEANHCLIQLSPFAVCIFFQRSGYAIVYHLFLQIISHGRGLRSLHFRPTLSLLAVTVVVC